ncbi:MAG: hypothetical protein U1E39_10355 [Planctomycetota bacterium]
MKLLPLPDRLLRVRTADDAWSTSTHPSDLLELVGALVDEKPESREDAAEVAAIAAAGDRLRREVARAGLAVFERRVVPHLGGRDGGPSRLGWFATTIRTGVVKLRAALAATPLDVAAVHEVEALGEGVRADRGARRTMAALTWMQSTAAVDALSKIASIAIAPRGRLSALGMQLVREVRGAHDDRLALNDVCREFADALRECVTIDLARFDENDFE